MTVKHIVILGNHIQALGLARQLKSMEVNVILFVSDSFSITRFSNAISKTIFFSDERNLLQNIKTLYEGEKNTLLFPTNDAMVLFLQINREILGKEFHIGLPESAIVETFYNKQNTHLFALKHKIPVPETYFPEDLKELSILADRLSYPQVLKPAVMHTFHQIFGKKAFKCDTKHALIEKAKKISLQMPIKGMMVQEFLDGGAKYLYSYGTFALKGKPMASVIVNRIRQNPMVFGNSTTFARTCNIFEVKELAEKILSTTNYTGLAEIEFMYNPLKQEYKFLEINTRAWKWHYISNGLGFSFINSWVQHLNGNNPQKHLDFNKKIAWVERLTDFSVAFKEILKGRMCLSSFINSYHIKKEYAVWNKNDMKPFFMYLFYAPILFFSRH